MASSLSRKPLRRPLDNPFARLAPAMNRELSVRWRPPVDDAGGEAGTHDIAVAGTTERDRQDARRWLLAYNEDDVRATFVLREWMARGGAAIPSIG